jgi:protein Tex
MVSNVTNFGAFVDIGVHQDGLVHISELSQRYVRDPRDVVQVGQVVKVRVLSVDVALQRISLSMKGLRPTSGLAEGPRAAAAAGREATPPARRRRKRVAPPPKPPAAPPPETDMAEKLRALQAHFQSPGRS